MTVADVGVDERTSARSNRSEIVRVVDAHIHLWDGGELDCDWTFGGLGDRVTGEALSDLVAQAPDAETEFIFVQAQARDGLAEARWVAELEPALRVNRIVARANLERGAAVRDQLDELLAVPGVVGVRRVLHREPVGFALQPAFVAGAAELARAGLTFDANIRPTQLGEIAALADAVPDLSIVLDHLGNPDMSQPMTKEWERDIRELAARPNVTVKLSGLGSGHEIGPVTEVARALVELVLESFGADRAMYGSDWPIHPSCPEWFVFLSHVVTDCVGVAGRDAVFGATADRIYHVRSDT